MISQIKRLYTILLLPCTPIARMHLSWRIWGHQLYLLINICDFEHYYDQCHNILTINNPNKIIIFLIHIFIFFKERPYMYISSKTLNHIAASNFRNATCYIQTPHRFSPKPNRLTVHCKVMAFVQPPLKMHCIQTRHRQLSERNRKWRRVMVGRRVCETESNARRKGAPHAQLSATDTGVGKGPQRAGPVGPSSRPKPMHAEREGGP